MGTDQVRINDREYIHKLIERVEEEYQKEEEKKARALEEDERKRVRGLVAKGVITPDDINDMDSQKKENQRELRTPPPYDENQDKLVTEKPKPFIYFDENNKRIQDEEENNEEEQDEEEEEQEDNEENNGEENNENSDESAEHKDDDVDPLILNLREGNTVDELYRRAEELLRGSGNAGNAE